MLADGDDAPALVVLLKAREDLVRAAAGWYRIPLGVRTARIAADYLAFYQPAAFAPAQRWGIFSYAAVRGYHIATRRDLIPEEPDHPRAGQRYYRVDVGPLQPLPRPVPAARLRRITFIPTTLGRLLTARDVSDLWIRRSQRQSLWDALQEAAASTASEAFDPAPDDERWPARAAWGAESAVWADFATSRLPAV